MMKYHCPHIRSLTRFIICAIVLSIFMSSCGEDEEEPIKIPDAPDGLTHILAKGKVSLSWNEAKYAETYRIYRGPEVVGSFPIIGSSTTNAYDDAQVTPGNIYVYKITAVSSDGVEGKFSAPYQVPYEEGTLQVPQEPVELGESGTHYDLKLKNTGGLALHWELETKDDWITFDPTEGDLNPQQERIVRIAVKRTGDPGEYSGSVVIKTDSGQGDIQISVKMQIAAEPRMNVDPTEFTFNGPGQANTLTIQNTGTGILTWEVQNIPDWLTLDATDGQTSSLSPSRIHLTIGDSQQLQPDNTYTATLSVVSNDTSNPEVTINAILNVPPLPPKLDVSDDHKHLIFGPKESNRSITIRNAGGGTMTWSVQVDSAESWLRVDPQNGETDSGNPDPLTFTVDREQGIPGRTLKSTVSIDAGVAGTQPVVIEVPIPEESWTVSPESLTLDSDTSKNILIRNSGEEKLHWEAYSEEFWLILSDKNGEIEPGGTHSLKISADHAGLTLGSHVSRILLTTKGGKQASVRVQTIKVGYITGTAMDSHSGRLVVDILISLDGNPSKSYAAGDFRIERGIPGAFQLKAEREGYLPAIFNGTLDNRGKTAPVEMWMRPIPRVIGTIADPVRQFAAPVDICFSGDGTRAYVADELGTVSIINVVTDTVVDQMDVGVHPMGVVAHPTGDEVYVADAEAHQVLVLDVRSREIVSSIDVDRYPQQLAISQDGNQLYVTCRDSASVVLIDIARRQVELRFPVGFSPYGLALSRDGMTLYVANSGDNSVSVMDAFTGRSLEVIQVARNPQYLAVSDDYVYVSNSLGDRVSVISQSSHRLVDHIEVGAAILLGDLAVLQEPRGGDVVYVIDQTNSVLHLIDSVTMEAIDDDIPVGDMPAAIAISPDLTKIYVVNSGSANISVLEF